ncbi:cation-transporting P-type ATPase [Candidatus Uhrbacteria bacterium]|nr:cation-transporting P-type ATPase [Candidatus Uhrbacteria bacterium]
MSDSVPAWYALSVDEVFRHIVSGPAGLCQEEATRRLRAQGSNLLPRDRPLGWWRILARQFASPLMLVLFAAVAVSVWLGDALDAAVIAAAGGLNVLVGFIQEYKANHALEQLRNLVMPQALVLREGRETRIAATDVVVGDLLVLRAGDHVAADARLVACTNLEANEAPLTGESAPIPKSVEAVSETASLADRGNMVYAGTTIAAGRGRALVVATGSHTELGGIAALVQAERARLTRWISGGILAFVFVLFAGGMAVGNDPVVLFQTAVALAVAAIPEGLAVSVTVALAIGAGRVLKRRALVRRLVAAETLGSVSVICTDKTGTITQGNMRVVEVLSAGSGFPPELLLPGSVPTDAEFLLSLSVLCNDATIEEPSRGVGTPTERALVLAGHDAGISLSDLRVAWGRIDEISFDSSRKFMTTLHRQEGVSPSLLIAKGAPERILDFCASVWEEGGERPLGQKARTAWQQRIDEASAEGKRVLGVAYRLSETSSIPRPPAGLVLAGFVVLQDPLRPDAREQVRAAAAAGIRTVLVTGDHPKTAAAIATEAGILRGPDRLATGDMVNQWTDDELVRRAEWIDVYARVEPGHKARIIHAWQAKGASVAMTGDGVNDAPALKVADIGVALGSGTEAAKQASDMVLLDDRIGTLSTAVEEGRAIFENVRKVLAYLMASCFTETILIAGALLARLPLPLLPVQILWINLVADTFPAVGLALGRGEPDAMRCPPRPRREPVLSREMALLVFGVGAAADVLLFGVYAWYLSVVGDLDRARTLLFAAAGVSSLLYALVFKSLRRPLFSLVPPFQPWLPFGVLAGLALMAVALFVPFFQNLFHVVPLTLTDGLIVAAVAVIKLAAAEVGKRKIFRSQA